MRFRKSLKLSGLLVVATLSLTGCGSDSDDSEGPPADPSTETTLDRPAEQPTPQSEPPPEPEPDPRPTPAEWMAKNVEQRPIAFDAERKRQMAEYSLRHYGDEEWRLTDPKLVVIHFAVAGDLESIRSTFEGHAEHNGEPPNTCTHFAIDGEGTTIQMVDTGIRCRHVIGLNDVALGIEHTGFSDDEVLGDEEEMKASLGLVQALRCRYGLPVSAVIGHNESPGSPYFHRDDPHAGLGVHSDFNQASMDRYRERLRRLGPCSRRFAEN